MPKLSEIIAKAVKDVQPEINEAVAKSVNTVVAKPAGKVTAVATSSTPEQDRLAEAGFIVKSLRGGKLTEADLKDLNARAKAIGVTGDFAANLPDGFTGTLIRDIQDELNVAKLFPMRQIAGGIAHDLIALHGVTAYLIAEGADSDDSVESYATFVATTQKVIAKVRKSYELVEDSLINVADEVRMEIVRAVAEAVEVTVINGDIAGTMDAGTAAKSAVRVSNGLRKTGLGKATVDFGGSAYTEAEFLAKINEMQLAGGVYLDERAVARGDVALIIDQHTYANIRNFDSFKTIDVAGRMATLFGGKVRTIFDIPLIVTSGLPAVDATGVVHATAGNNTFSTCVMVNVSTCRLSARGNVLTESDKNIENQHYIWTGGLRYGFSSVYDSTEAAPNTIVSTYKNVAAGINIAR